MQMSVGVRMGMEVFPSARGSLLAVLRVLWFEAEKERNEGNRRLTWGDDKADGISTAAVLVGPFATRGREVAVRQ